MDKIERLFDEYLTLLEKGLTKKEILEDFRSYLHPITYSRLMKAVELDEKKAEISEFIREHRRMRQR